MIEKNQQRLTEGKFYLINLIYFHDDMSGCMDKDRAMMAVYLDCIKAFDMICHCIFDHMQIVCKWYSWGQREIDIMETRAVILRNFDKKANRNLKKFNKSKCKILHVKEKKPM